MTTTEPQFALPVDSEHKALKINLLSFALPHMRAFHLCWFGFFTSFVSTFAPAAMIPVVREDLGLSKADLGNAGIAAVSGTIAARVAMGAVCDWIGPRLGMSAVLMMTAPCVFGMALANKALDFTLLRFGIGFGLSTFVSCQFWTASMFNVKIVGIANATTGGWGNLGGGVTQLLMPLVFRGISQHTQPFLAWRWSMFVPAFMHIIGGMGILFFSLDLPDGNYAVLKKSGGMSKDSPLRVFITAISNYRMWCLTVTYGFCFGVELTMNNIIVTYLFDQFGVSLTIAGVLGSLFGLMNLFARSIGGLGSDLAGKRFGMRGRLWALWSMQTFEGALCIFMGLAKGSLPATIVIMVIFSLFVQASEGASYGVVPFVSKRALGVVSGFIGAGGNAGSVITQTLFFKDETYETYNGLVYMGIMVMAMTLLVVPIYFPMWGGMLCGPREGVVEEDYYLGEFSEEERAAGLADAAMKFAQESKSQRGSKQREANVDDIQLGNPPKVESTA